MEENIKIKLGKFTLESSKGVLNRNEIIGVLGENGTGKSSFVKALAKQIETEGKTTGSERKR